MFALFVLTLHAFKMLPTVLYLTVRVIILRASYTVDARANPMHCACAAVKLQVTTGIFVYQKMHTCEYEMLTLCNLLKVSHL